MRERDAAATVAADSDRRDSPRLPIRMMVRDPSLGGSFEEREGDLAVGGVYFTAPHPPAGSEVELRLVLPGGPAEVMALGEVLHVARVRGGFGAHVRFVHLSLEAERAIARHLDRNGR